MCGIAGIFHIGTAKPVGAERVRAMADAQAHRGPDGAGVWVAPGVGLGHRRLAIVDIVGGAQPMVSGDGTLAVTYNGEIYNHVELRAELERRGHGFRTASDTEVILAGWREWGAGCLDHFNGMFAFALYDAERQCLFLARDRLGVKPLHYATVSDGSLIFASELKGLLVHPLIRREPDLRAVEDYMAFGYVPDDACIVSGVHKLPAGTRMLVARGKPLPAPERWWDVDFSARARGSRAALQEELLARLRDGVRSRMGADVPLGAFLSGGVDSASVVALMAEASPRAVSTCTIGFREAGHDESSYAAAVAKRFATEHRSRIVDADDFVLIDRLAAAFDEPFADASALATYRLCELARETVTVALAGDGADEALAGYRRYRFHAAEERVRGRLPAGLRRPLFGAAGRLYPKVDWAPRPLRAKATLLALAEDGGEAYARAVGVTPPELRARLFNDGFRRAIAGHRAEERYALAMRDAPALGGLDRAQYADLKIWLPGDILTKVDRTSMAVGLEAREPLLDHRLVEFAASLPPGLRLRGGEGKWLMKKAMAAYLPRDILHRPKMGFVTPVGAWFRGALAGEAERIATSSAVAATGWFEPKAVAAVVAAHRSGRSDHGRLLWQLVVLDRAVGRLFGAG
ncbi:XrtA/PEP-CTERM system amidotransferase [Sphingomonas flavalba]|uniref:XrtA/PEP-CTERM system amidotransferase n=1 Tax=Sphingomonas flavalba TaxID=2559804 RepID=UPI00109DAC58|nr:XrtA/PEP-CTERM system amidotransferase [Sphingomonas flavalba]